MHKIVILHFSPLELYPPIQNLLVQLDKAKAKINVRVVTTQMDRAAIGSFDIKSERIKIFRYGKSGRMPASFIRYWNYLRFQIGAICALIVVKPHHIFYFETLSSFPVYVYKCLFGSNAKIFIHYHEYTSPKEFQTVKLLGFLHRLEKRLLSLAVWVSHTNAYRMKLFKKDISPTQIRGSFIVPNYPPLSWLTAPRNSSSLPLKIVYIGALSLDTMHSENFAYWIVKQRGEVLWDIYSYNYSYQVKDFLEKLNCPWIKLKPGVEYNQLPSILSQYSVGVILYNGHIPNYIYNAPNKLFEYFACGLNVWFPSEMIGSYDYLTEDTYPKVIKLDFTNLDSYDLETLASHGKASYLHSEFYCDSALLPLIAKLTADD